MTMRRCFTWATLLALTGCSGSDDADAWNHTFRQLDGFGWCGGDAAYSVDLPGDRTLWLFGDTLVGSVQEGARRDVEPRFGNSVAIQQRPPPGGSILLPPFQPVFHWGPPGSGGWLPIREETLSSPAAPASLAEAPDKVVAWPLHGAVVGADLALFHIAVTFGGCSDCGLFDFRSHGATLSVVRGVDRAYEDWGVTERGWSAESHPAQAFVPPELGADILWGAWVLAVEADLLVYGSREHARGRDLVVARVSGVQRAEDLFAFGQWTFWDGSSWASTVDRAAAIATDLAPEISLAEIPDEHGGGFVLVHGGPDALAPVVSLATARAPWGPFVERHTVPLATTSLVDPESLFVYAIKAHPHLSTEEALLVSFVTLPVEYMAEPRVPDALEHYVPRFLTVPWKDI
jgi:hypothetical protein